MIFSILVGLAIASFLLSTLFGLDLVGDFFFVLGLILTALAIISIAFHYIEVDGQEIKYVTEEGTQVCTKESVMEKRDTWVPWAQEAEYVVKNGVVDCVPIPED